MIAGERVLIAGGTGMTGSYLTHEMLFRGLKVLVVSMDDITLAHPEAEFLRLDLTNPTNCEIACRDVDYVVNLLCIKSSLLTQSKRPALFFKMLEMNSNLIKAAVNAKVKKFLYT